MMNNLPRLFDQLHDTRPPPSGAAAVLDGARRQAIHDPPAGRRRSVRLALAVGAVAFGSLLVFATWPADETSVTTGPAGRPAGGTTTAPPAPTAAPSTAAVDPALAPGRHFGYLRSVDGAGRTIEFDEAAFLDGDAAVAAARQRGDLLPNDVLPNDIYIVNDDEWARTMQVRPDVR